MVIIDRCSCCFVLLRRCERSEDQRVRHKCSRANGSYGEYRRSPRGALAPLLDGREVPPCSATLSRPRGCSSGFTLQFAECPRRSGTLRASLYRLVLHHVDRLVPRIFWSILLKGIANISLSWRLGSMYHQL